MNLTGGEKKVLKFFTDFINHLVQSCWNSSLQFYIRENRSSYKKRDFLVKRNKTNKKMLSHLLAHALTILLETCISLRNLCIIHWPMWCLNPDLEKLGSLSPSQNYKEMRKNSSRNEKRSQRKWAQGELLFITMQTYFTFSSFLKTNHSLVKWAKYVHVLFSCKHAFHFGNGSRSGAPSKAEAEKKWLYDH